MSNITTVEAVIEVTTEITVKWEINDDEFKEWAGHALADSHPQAVKEFLESGRDYYQEIKDHVDDVARIPGKPNEYKIDSVSL